MATVPTDAEIDAELDRLRSPTTTDERLAILQKLVTYWHGPINPNDGLTDLPAGTKLPRTLQWWYAWAGRRREIMSCQNDLLDPDKIRVEDGHLLFYVEHQRGYLWAAAMEGDDPRVFGRVDARDPWKFEGLVLSEHLIAACLFEAVLGADYRAAGVTIAESIFDEIIRRIPSIAIAPWHWVHGVQMHVRNGAFMISMPASLSVYLGAKSPAPIAFLQEFIDDSWIRVDI